MGEGAYIILCILNVSSNLAFLCLPRDLEKKEEKTYPFLEKLSEIPSTFPIDNFG